MILINEHQKGLRFLIKVQAGAGQSAVAGCWQQALKLKINKKPEGGEANKACLRFLAKKLGIAQRQLSIVQGLHHKEKLMQVTGMSKDDLAGKLKDLLAIGGGIHD